MVRNWLKRMVIHSLQYVLQRGRWQRRTALGIMQKSNIHITIVTTQYKYSENISLVDLSLALCFFYSLIPERDDFFLFSFTSDKFEGVQFNSFLYRSKRDAINIILVLFFLFPLFFLSFFLSFRAVNIFNESSSLTRRTVEKSLRLTSKRYCAREFSFFLLSKLHNQTLDKHGFISNSSLTRRTVKCTSGNFDACLSRQMEISAHNTCLERSNLVNTALS